MGQRLIVQQLKGNKFEIRIPWLNTLDVVHYDRLKRTNAKPARKAPLLVLITPGFQLTHLTLITFAIATHNLTTLI